MVNSTYPQLSLRDRASRAGVPLLALLLAIICGGQVGCVRRRMTIRTSPPGAQVFVDDQEIGTTPCSTSFVYYGTRKITVIKDGYQTETLYQKFSPPWYEIPPLDFVSENLTPQEVRDERALDIQLKPQELVPEDKLRERAENIRLGARTGQITPLGGPAQPPPSDRVQVQQSPPPNIGLPGQGLPFFQPQPYTPLLK